MKFLKFNSPHFLFAVSLVSAFLAISVVYFAFLNNRPEIITVEKSNVIQNPNQPLKNEVTPEYKQNTLPLNIEIYDFKTDKDTYGSDENIEISLVVSSQDEFKNAVILISGIKPSQRAYINEVVNLDINPGENPVIVNSQTPFCTKGCGGVYPGPYDIKAEILIDGSLITHSFITINLIDD